MALLTQQDIRAHYRQFWAQEKQRSDAGNGSLYGSAAEDLVVTPILLNLFRDLKIKVQGGDVLDVGCGAGRWVHFFLKHAPPRLLVGADVTPESVELLRSRHASTAETAVEFRTADITDPSLDLGQSFDLINIANVLFHIPEPELYRQALGNLRKHVKPGGHVLTTEYLPRTDMRTPWMQVRSRYSFEKLVAAAGLRIVAIRAFTVFNNDPMGLDGPDDGPRGAFNAVRAQAKMMEQSIKDAGSREFFNQFMANLDRAFLAFCRERLADIDLPSQKLVVLTPIE